MAGRNRNGNGNRNSNGHRNANGNGSSNQHARNREARDRSARVDMDLVEGVRTVPPSGSLKPMIVFRDNHRRASVLLQNATLDYGKFLDRGAVLRDHTVILVFSAAEIRILWELREMNRAAVRHNKERLWEFFVIVPNSKRQGLPIRPPSLCSEEQTILITIISGWAVGNLLGVIALPVLDIDYRPTLVTGDIPGGNRELAGEGSGVFTVKIHHSGGFVTNKTGKLVFFQVEVDYFDEVKSEDLKLEEVNLFIDRIGFCRPHRLFYIDPNVAEFDGFRRLNSDQDLKSLMEITSAEKGKAVVIYRIGVNEYDPLPGPKPKRPAYLNEGEESDADDEDYEPESDYILSDSDDESSCKYANESMRTSCWASLRKPYEFVPHAYVPETGDSESDYTSCDELHKVKGSDDEEEHVEVKRISKEDPTFEVRTVKYKHTCDKIWEKNRNCNSNIVSNWYLADFAHDPRISVGTLQFRVLNEKKITISITQAWKAKTKALKKVRGSIVEQYVKLEGYMKETKKLNPGTTFELMKNPNPEHPNTFKRKFWKKRDGPQLQPPEFKHKIGRPKGSRNKRGSIKASRKKGKGINKCSKCNVTGHIRRYCPDLPNQSNKVAQQGQGTVVDTNPPIPKRKGRPPKKNPHNLVDEDISQPVGEGDTSNPQPAQQKRRVRPPTPHSKCKQCKEMGHTKSIFRDAENWLHDEEVMEEIFNTPGAPANYIPSGYLSPDDGYMHEGCRRCRSNTHDEDNCSCLDFKCDRCNYFGHLRNECPLSQEELASKLRPSSSTDPTAPFIAQNDDVAEQNNIDDSLSSDQQQHQNMDQLEHDSNQTPHADERSPEREPTITNVTLSGPLDVQEADVVILPTVVTSPTANKANKNHKKSAPSTPRRTSARLATVKVRFDADGHGSSPEKEIQVLGEEAVETSVGRKRAKTFHGQILPKVLYSLIVSKGSSSILIVSFSSIDVTQTFLELFAVWISQ
ncbi:OLC1v1031273C1 [Oldenlandia corymbosa var. corymbosa]|uniref:OLC1v1031273C1 n=1 Tax=Oldenlandia corymbosa var. corymbosa TaxID=529605 RepID=A0AAV1CJQ8_OLDCO|nr:OLC1v1031273C1 [Oldenlandia corymbosa var. corymbosa]